VRGPIVVRANQLKEELARGVKKPFEKIIMSSVGDCHAMGQKPITFTRQVIAGCAYPELLNQKVFPTDVVNRCREILGTIRGSIGCYSESIGLSIVRKHAAQFIAQRDGYPADPNNLILTNGASQSVKYVLELFISEKEKSGALVPVPQYPLYSATISEFGMERVGYYLNEEKDWALDVSELRRALAEGRKTCNPRVLCIINPGNPTGQVYTYDNMKEIIQFCIDENLVLMADEVYQENIYREGATFHSFKKVLHDMGAQHGFQMASFFSCSKGFAGECGLRGSYVEIIGVDEETQYQLNKLQSAQLGSNVTGMIALDCVVKQPQPGDISYTLFNKEKSYVLNSLKERARYVYKRLNAIEGITCREVAGAMYAFPRLHLPQTVIAKAQSLNQAPDFLYCMELLEETGICVVPGSGFKQRAGTHHFRMTILPPMEDLVVFLDKLTTFHQRFMERYSDKCQHFDGVRSFTYKMNEIVQ